MTKQYKKMAFPVLSMLLLAVFYLFCGRLGDNAERLIPVSPGKLLPQALDICCQVAEFLFPLSLQLTTKGFLRGLALISVQRLWVWFILLLILSALFFAASKKTAFHSTVNKAASPLAASGGRRYTALFAHVHFAKGENFTRASNQYFYIIGNHNFLLYKKSAMGILLTVVPFMPFFISADAGLNFRNIVPALLGISLIFEDLIIRFFRRLTPVVGAVAVIVFSVAALTEVTDYNFTAAQDLKIAVKIAEELPPDAQSVTCKISTPDYYPQSAPVGDHIKSMTASDWGATGIVRTLTGNKEVTVTLINFP